MCKYLDLLAPCTSPTGCTHTGALQLSNPNSPASAGSLGVKQDIFPLTATLGPNATVEVPTRADAATLAALPLLEISVSSSPSGETNVPIPPGAVVVLLDGAPFTACTPQNGGDDSSLTWDCPLPQGTKTVALEVADIELIDVSMQLIESTCTGSETFCAE